MTFIHKIKGEADHPHETVAEAKDCMEWHEYVASGQADADSAAELAAEQRNERWFEERGASEPEDPREIEAQMRYDEMRHKELLRYGAGLIGWDDVPPVNPDSIGAGWPEEAIPEEEKPAYEYKGQMVRHETPCVCGAYDRCRELRAADATWSGNWRDNFRAYND